MVKYMKSIFRVLCFQTVKLLSLILGVSLVAYLLVRLSPIDPVQQFMLGMGSVSEKKRIELEAYWGVNESFLGQYIQWIKAVLKGDFGMSLLYRRPVIDIIRERFLNSFLLMFLSWITSGIVGFIIGSIMGMYSNRFLDRILKKVCIFLSAVPTFWIGLLSLLVFSVHLGWFPIGFRAPIGVLNDEVTMFQKLYHMILPSLTLSFLSFSNIALHTREKLIQVLESDYVIFAKARGESKWMIFKRHGIRNMILPWVTLQFASFSEVFGGSVLIENVFSYPGLGQAVAAAGLNSDVPLLLGITVISSGFVFIGNFIADHLYGFIDPKFREDNSYE